MHKVTLTDPSFTRELVRFEEGRSKAKLTFGTIAPNKAYHVNLEVTPLKPQTIFLQKSTLTYQVGEQTKNSKVFTEQELKILSAAQVLYTALSVQKAFTLLTCVVLVSVVPMYYANSLKNLRLTKIKRS